MHYRRAHALSRCPSPPALSPHACRGQRPLGSPPVLPWQHFTVLPPSILQQHHSSSHSPTSWQPVVLNPVGAAARAMTDPI